MKDQELRKLLEKLHGEIENTKSVDEKGRELLHDLSADIRELLARSGGRPAEPTVIQRLDESIQHFEVTHPELTATLSQLLTTLSNAGI